MMMQVQVCDDYTRHLQVLIENHAYHMRLANEQGDENKEIYLRGVIRGLSHAMEAHQQYNIIEKQEDPARPEQQAYLLSGGVDGPQ